jgi:polygalacturonase
MSLSVKDFGAVGDGLTPDTEAFQNALNAAATFGAIVEVPPTHGAYRLTSTVAVPPIPHF